MLVTTVCKDENVLGLDVMDVAGLCGVHLRYIERAPGDRSFGSIGIVDDFKSAGKASKLLG